MKPRVLIAIATDAIGGPGKCLFQFLHELPSEAAEYVLCNFQLAGRRDGEFVTEARRRRLNLRLLKQRATLDPLLILEARKAVQQHNLNLVQTHGYKSNVIGFFLKRLFGMPWIGFAHGHTDDNWKVRLYNRLDLAVLRHADRVVAVSAATLAWLRDRGVSDARLRLIYNAVDLDAANDAASPNEIRRRHGIADDAVVVGVVGRFNPEKGQIVFLKAMRRIIRSYPQVRALMIGDGQDRGALERYCQDHGLAEHVIFTGYRDDVGAYYQAMDVLVLPSLSEGLPNTVLEAMSHAVPVVATTVGGVPEILDQTNGVLIPPGDDTALSENLMDLLRNETRRKEIGKRGRESLYPRFAPEHRTKQIVQLYSEVLTGA